MGPMMGPAEEFVSEHHHTTMITHRRDGGIQASLVRAFVDSSGRIVVCSRAQTAKAHNLARDPRCALCVTDITGGKWSGPWMTIEATAELVRLPDALEPLREFYQRRDGSIGPEDEFVARMEAEGRLIVRLHVTRTSDSDATGTSRR